MYVVRHVMSLNSVQPFVIENCNGSSIENGLNNVCLYPLSGPLPLQYVMLHRADYNDGEEFVSNIQVNST